jgi:indolepyruvate ferredoxin oxidoreductase beta subunit
VKEKVQVLISGIGGQGILFTTRVLAEAALMEGKEVICAETHGMAQRGASVVSHVRIGGYQSPLIQKGTAEYLLNLDKGELQSSLLFLRPEGLCFLNASGVPGLPDPLQDFCTHNRISILAYDATGIALRMGFIRGANQALLGFACARTMGIHYFPTSESLIAAIQKISGQAVRQKNIDAFIAGYRAGNDLI